jgi:hypothetical protein
MKYLCALCCCLALLARAGERGGADRLGGHFGAVFPLVTHANGETTTISDDFVIGFPMGITVKTGSGGPSISSWFPSFRMSR